MPMAILKAALSSFVLIVAAIGFREVRSWLRWGV